MPNNGNDVEISRPLKHRQGVMVVRSNGTRKVIGDGSPFTQSEYVMLQGGYVESTTPRLKFNQDEQAELEQAKVRLERASGLVDQLYAEGNRLSAEMKAACHSADPYSQRRLTDREQDRIRNLEAQAHELTGRIDEARELEKSALIESNATQRRVIAAVRARQFPPTFHHPKLSTAERLANLEEGK